MPDSKLHAIRPARGLFALLLVASAGVHADPFEDALQHVRLAIATPGIVVDYCMTAFPDLADPLHAGFDQWKRREADLIFEIETRAERATRQKALRDEARYAELVKEHDLAMDNYRKAYRADLARITQAEQRRGCREYASDLNNGAVNVSNLEKTLASQLEVLRKRDAGRPRGR